jgi:hypothetical protein
VIWPRTGSSDVTASVYFIRTIVADVATWLTPNVSAALLAADHARSHNGGGWCANAGR